jgi:hypothetical protein
MGSGKLPALSGCVALVIFAGIAATKWAPFIQQDRQVISSTPSLAGLAVRSDVVVRPKSTACVRPVAFDPDTSRAQFLLTGRVSALDIRVVATYGQERAPARRVLLGGGDPHGLSAMFAPPRKRALGAVCVENSGPRSFSLVGTTEARSLALADTYVDGRRQAPDVALTLLTSRNASLAAQATRALARASVLTGGFVSVGVIWAAIALMAIALTCVFAAFGLASHWDALETE